MTLNIYLRSNCALTIVAALAARLVIDLARALVALVLYLSKLLLLQYLASSKLNI